ncbi:hypothetical protein HPB48_003593 [Haemaphysalis longicornis]|uniref:LIM zinc-binding domain-containing protein n=1 Tax=Haemaphysalis longicornis TaxID=44386 RepID=A0A9J6FFT6_HAELO|nr:hypothetical protein HPB48_003593 [Haemaphysalis longicornis]
MSTAPSTIPAHAACSRREENWCPEHFLCSNGSCRKSLQDIGFVEEQGKLYCEHCYESYMAPICRKCGHRIKGICQKNLEGQSFFAKGGRPFCKAHAR